MDIKEIEKYIDDLEEEEETPKESKRISKKFASSILLVVMISFTLIASAGLISWYAQINVTINASPAILVDGLESPVIQDKLDLMCGETKNITHNVTNLNVNYTYVLGFETSNVTEGLNISFIVDDIESTNITIDANSTKDFTINYFVMPNAEPGIFEATIEVVFVEAF